ncbi:hypothetical protein [Microcoleus sp. bin38.metabat.b11b12b14.051]|uniref:hypothetical protein n=1 Tax=Microcoleus sp. bin38.metabat.b11b12b14.051 TaxID=2742709 RepID=UPI0025D426AA|nr:hypothetical protein [Microcoleus sp. bin38.metabat.b11b12b14.051]
MGHGALGIGRSEAEGWGMGHGALGEAKRRDGALGIGHWAWGMKGFTQGNKKPEGSSIRR